MRNRCYKYILLTLTGWFSFSVEVSGQVMEWVLPPEYKEVVCLGGVLYKVKNVNDKWGIYNISQGELTVPIEYENISPLVEGRALILDGQGERLYGIVDEQGKPVKPLVAANKTPDIVVVKDYPYYSDGLLVFGMFNPQNNLVYGYADKRGDATILPQYRYACPFSQGQAMVINKDGDYQIIDKHGVFHYQGNDRINFMSNPDRNGVFVLVTGGQWVSKAKLENGKIRRTGDLEKRRIVNVINAMMIKSISCRGGGTYQFNNAFQLVEGNAPAVISPVKDIAESSGSLRKVKDGQLYGISYSGATILSGQLKRVKIYDDQYAVATMPDNLTGVLQYNPLGKIDLKAESDNIDFYHHQVHQIPIKVTCSNWQRSPSVTLTIAGDNKKQTFTCRGSDQIVIPYYRAHDREGQLTEDTFSVEMSIDKLKYGQKEITVKSCHQKGYRIAVSGFPTYSRMDGSVTVEVTISSVGEPPSASAVANINNKDYRLYGKSEVTIPVKFSIPVRQEKNCIVNVVVKEEGCPNVTFSKSGTVKSYSLK